MQKSIKQFTCSTTLMDELDKSEYSRLVWHNKLRKNMVEIQKKSIGGATGSNYTGVVNREEECNYMTLCEHGDSKA